MGTLFDTPVATSVLDDAGVRVDVRWKPNSTIPAAFYASPTLDFTPAQQASREALSRLRDAGPEGASVGFKPTALGTTLGFSLRYVEGPARTCAHPGMDDTYVLSVSAVVMPDGGVQEATVTPSLELGAL